MYACCNIATSKPKIIIGIVRKVRPYMSPQNALNSATMGIHHLRSQWSEIRAASNAPGTAPSDIAEDQAREWTSENPCSASSVGTHAAKPKKPSDWHIHVNASMSVRGKYGGATSSTYPPLRGAACTVLDTGARAPTSLSADCSIRSRTASASSTRPWFSYHRGDSSSRLANRGKRMPSDPQTNTSRQPQVAIGMQKRATYAVAGTPNRPIIIVQPW